MGTFIIIQKELICRTMWGPSFGHERAISWPLLGKGDDGIHQELWYLAWSIPGHIDYDSGWTNWGTRWGPGFGHKRAIFLPFLGKGEYGIHPEFWNLAWSIPGYIDYDSGRINLKDHVLAINGPYLAISKKRGLWDTPKIVKFGMEHPGAHW